MVTMNSSGERELCLCVWGEGISSSFWNVCGDLLFINETDNLLPISDPSTLKFSSGRNVFGAYWVHQQVGFEMH